MGKRKWTFAPKSKNVHVITINLDRVGDSQECLLQSDVHWDNPKCERSLWERHMREARAKDAPILDNGDFFCAMQGKYDPRGSKKDIRPEHQKSNYLDALVDTAADALNPYLDLLTVRGEGNHETNILKRQETDLTSRLVEKLRGAGGQALKGGYSGWVRFQIRYNGTCRKGFTLWYNHGFGGGGPVTRGVIQTNRTAVYVESDIVWMGHTHDSWQLPIERIRLNRANSVEMYRQQHIRTAGYKEEYGDGSGGWHIERGGPPKPRGGAWLTFRQVSTDEVICELREAV